MIKYLTIDDILFLHLKLIDNLGGKKGVRDISFLESAINTPLQTFDSNDLYFGLVNKISRLSYELVKKHTFIDGNKRIGVFVLDVLLRLNSLKLNANVQETIDEFLGLAAGEIEYNQFYNWAKSKVEIIL